MKKRCINVGCNDLFYSRGRCKFHYKQDYRKRNHQTILEYQKQQRLRREPGVKNPHAVDAVVRAVLVKLYRQRMQRARRVPKPVIEVEYDKKMNVYYILGSASKCLLSVRPREIYGKV